jgi:hypothetical protein
VGASAALGLRSRRLPSLALEWFCLLAKEEQVTREELNKQIDETLAENRAALERAGAHFRKFRREAAIHTIRTERVFRELREAARRR